MSIDRILEKVLPFELVEDLKRNTRVVVDSALEDMHVVSRAEFEVQKKMVQKLSLEVKELRKLIEERSST